ncbi:hypothetical protein [Agrococcus baldri]|uniref:Bacteriocin biosynthesis cyclodehydratase domain-containing protein n=1 Tax=Agrococcus baldri TaxID=153730 RepID=A0AA87R952_9MICO|nr:hypothetical protein [Agrococcus baldri]GEK78889.1 hypothetical protein ABA31_02400 [Agrococcus baldri]
MLRLDPHLAVFRTAPDRVTIGAQQPLVELDADPPTLRAIAALTRGVLPRELEQLVGEEAAQQLLAALRPALVEAAPAVPVLVRGRIRLAHELHRAARDAGHPAGDGVIVPVAPWRLPALEAERLLASGVAHLPVVVGDAWVQVGPYAVAGGCAECAQPGRLAVLPAHLTPAPTAIAGAQALVTVLEALQRAGSGELPVGWAVRIRQRDGAVSSMRRRACRHRSTGTASRRPAGVAPVRALPGSGMAA